MRLGLCLPEHRRARGVESVTGLERVEPNVSFAIHLKNICTKMGTVELVQKIKFLNGT